MCVCIFVWACYVNADPLSRVCSIAKIAGFENTYYVADLLSTEECWKGAHCQHYEISTHKEEYGQDLCECDVGWW